MNLSEDFLLTFAEIFIALVGFSGVVTVLGRRNQRSWKPEEILRLRTLVEPSLAGLFGAFIPSTLGLVIASPDLLWRSANAVLAVLIGMALGAFIIRTRTAPTVLGQRVLTIISALILCGLIASTVNLIHYFQLTFALGLLLCLIVGVYNFSLLLFQFEQD